MTVEAGVLYVVATPIGHRDDISVRALAVLREVNGILAEDTRHSLPLMQHHGINTPLTALHEHNEIARVDSIARRLQAGESLALISDAGTPLISDPGFKLVRGLRERQLRVAPIPGASAVITALSAAGLATDRFHFEGFLPPKSAARREKLSELKTQTATLVFYEAPHRILETVRDASEVLGVSRNAVLCRELTKTFETFLAGTLGELAQRIASDENQQRGEIVLLIAGHDEQEQDAALQQAEQLLRVLLAHELVTRQAVDIVEQYSGLPHKKIYQLALAIKNESQ